MQGLAARCISKHAVVPVALETILPLFASQAKLDWAEAAQFLATVWQRRLSVRRNVIRLQTRYEQKATLLQQKQLGGLWVGRVAVMASCSSPAGVGRVIA